MDLWIKTSFNMTHRVREMLRWLAKENGRSMTKHLAYMIVRDYREEYDEDDEFSED
jgi:hypothetical protein